MQASRNSYDRIRNCVAALKRRGAHCSPGSPDISDISRFRAAFEAAMDDDFNTANAVTVIFDLVKFINVNIEDINAGAALSELLSLCDILGLRPDSSDNKEVDEDLIYELIDKRKAAKAGKDFAEADRIRGELLAMGIEIKDTREGTVWNAVG